MLVDLEVALVTYDGSLILSQGLVIVLLGLVEESDFDQGIGFPLESEGVGEDGVLEVADGLLDLVGLGKYHTKLVEHLTLLVEVGGHLQYSDQGADGVVV